MVLCCSAVWQIESLPWIQGFDVHVCLGLDAWSQASVFYFNIRPVLQPVNSPLGVKNPIIRLGLSQRMTAPG